MALNFPANPSLGQSYGDYIFDGSGWKYTQTVPGGLPCGSIIPWAGDTAPANWLLCDGAAVSRTTYASLFGLIGTTYGTGDGSTTFNVPDLRGRVPVGKNGGSFGTLGSTGGVESVTLTEAQMPSHTHVQNSHNHTLRTWVYNGGNPGSVGAKYGMGFQYNTGARNDQSAASSGEVEWGNIATTATNQNTGGGQAHTNLQPYQVVNYIIKTTVAITAGDSELATRLGVAESKVTALQTYTNNVRAKYSSRNITLQVDTTSRTAGSWTLGPTFANISFEANSKIKMMYHVPMRNDASGWGGMYIEPQVSFNDGTWQSLGTTGHELMHLGNADITTYRNEILLTPGISTAFTAKFRFYFRAYEGTVGWNNGINHDINASPSGTATQMSGDNGNQHYMHIIVEEFATG